MTSGRYTFDKKAFVRGLIMFIAAFAAMKVSKGYASAIFPVLAVSACARKKYDFLILLMFVMMAVFIGNHYLVTRSAVSAIVMRLSFAVVALAMAFRMAAGLSNRYAAPLLGIFPYLVWEAAVSLWGWSPVVSYLKLLLFCGIFIALHGMACLAAAGPVSSERQRAFILSGAAFMILGSAALIPFPAIGMMNPDDILTGRADIQYVTSLFKGVTAHSQCLGPIVAVLVTLVFGDMLFTVRGWRLFHLLIVVSGFVLIYKTSSRTAMGSLIGGMGMVSWLFMRSNGIGQRWKGKVFSVITMVAILSTCVVVCVPSVQRKAATFLLKFGEIDAVEKVSFNDIVATRQALFDNALYNFRKKPLTGNGFQVSEDMSHVVRRSFYEYLAAPVEKGVWISAVLEEGGVVGFALFSGFLLVAFFKFVSRKAYIAASALFTLTVVNMGEFTFFSMSGPGGMEWTAVFCAVVLDAHRNKAIAWSLQPWRMQCRAI